MLHENFKKCNQITVRDCHYGSSQPAMIPSSRSVLSGDKREALDTWNQSGLQENVSGNQISMFDSFRDHRQGIHPCHHKENEDQFHTTGTEILFARDDNEFYNTGRPTADLQGRTADTTKIAIAFRQIPLIHNRFRCGKLNS